MKNVKTTNISVHNQLVRATALSSLVLVASLCMGSKAQAACTPVSTGATGASVVCDGSDTNIDQSAQRALLNWSNFDTSDHEAVNFRQPNSEAIALNRIDSATTQFNGKLNANGQVVLLNKNGIVLGKDSQVNVGRLVVGAADIHPGEQEKFLKGADTIRFEKPGLANATVTFKDKAVDTITIDPVGDGLIEFEAGKSDIGLVIDDKTTIDSVAGIKTARSLAVVEQNTMYDGAINIRDVISAKGAPCAMAGGVSSCIEIADNRLIPSVPVEPPPQVRPMPLEPIGTTPAPVEPPPQVRPMPLEPIGTTPAPVEPPPQVKPMPLEPIGTTPAPVEPPPQVKPMPLEPIGTTPAPVEPPPQVKPMPLEPIGTTPAPVEPPPPVKIPPVPVEPPPPGRVPPMPVEPPEGTGVLNLPQGLFGEDDRDPLDRELLTWSNVLRDQELAYTKEFSVDATDVNLSILGQGAASAARPAATGLTPEQMGSLAPAAGGNLGDLAPSAGGLRGATTVNCANAFFENPTASLDNCTAGSSL